MYVPIRALSVRDNKNGTFTLELDSKELSREQQQVLADLFPHHETQIGQLLENEALISSVATRLEENAPEVPQSARPKAKWDDERYS